MTNGVVHVRRPKAIVFDILGTATKSGFLERILFPFLKLNLETYLNQHWDKSDFIKLYKRIQEFSSELNGREPASPLVLAHSSPQAKQSLLSFLNYCLENGLQPPAVTQLRFKVWFEGYQTARLLTPIYSDVPTSLRRWFAEGIKFYVFSNTWVEAQKALLRNTSHGDLTNLIAGNFDNEFGLLSEPDSWRRFCAQIRESPNNVLFLTKSPLEARAAQDAGMQVVLVLTHRHNVKAVGHDDRHRFPFVRTLLDLQWVEQTQQQAAGAAASGASAVVAPAPSGSTVVSGTSTGGAGGGGGSSAATTGPSGFASGAGAGAASGASGSNVTATGQSRSRSTSRAAGPSGVSHASGAHVSGAGASQAKSPTSEG